MSETFHYGTATVEVSVLFTTEDDDPQTYRENLYRAVRERMEGYEGWRIRSADTEKV